MGVWKCNICCMHFFFESVVYFSLKVPSPIASDFFQTFGDFGVRSKLIFFSLPPVNFTAEKCTIWKILMKMWLVMVNIIAYTIRYRQLQNTKSCLVSKRFNWFIWNLKPLYFRWWQGWWWSTLYFNKNFHFVKSDQAPLNTPRLITKIHIEGMKVIHQRIFQDTP